MTTVVGLSIRTAAALAAAAILTGAVVSCAGDSSDSDSSGGSSTRPDSAAMGQWSPDSRFTDECPKSLHDTYYVVGPDGKRYPTWHSPTTTDPATGRTCYFGHEHGMNPSASSWWDDIRRHYAFDANGNGSIDDSELAAGGIPFGYVEEQLDAFNAANGTASAIGQRRMPHTSFKIYVNNGIRRDQRVDNATQSYDLTCAVLYAYNQNTATADAFASNLHPLLAAIDCDQGTQAASNPIKIVAGVLAPFGRAGTIDAGAVDGTTADLLPLDALPVPANSATVAPGSAADARLIPTYAERTRDNLFVAVGSASDLTAGLRERWETTIALVRNGSNLAQLTTALVVDDPIRYYGRDGTLDYSVDLCYAGLDSGGNWVDQPGSSAGIVRRPRGTNDCTVLAPNGAATLVNARVAFDDLTSPFRNCTRRMTLGDTRIANGGTGTEVWYTNPWGGAAQTTRFTGSVKQFVARGASPAGIVLAETDLLAANPDGCASAQRIHAPN